MRAEVGMRSEGMVIRLPSGLKPPPNKYFVCCTDYSTLFRVSRIGGVAASRHDSLMVGTRARTESSSPIGSRPSRSSHPRMYIHTLADRDLQSSLGSVSDRTVGGPSVYLIVTFYPAAAPYGLVDGRPAVVAWGWWHRERHFHLAYRRCQPDQALSTRLQ